MISHKGKSIKLILIVLLYVFVSGDAEVRCIESEREALLSFKNGLIDEYDVLSSWQSKECCKWHGVECSSTTGHVTTLQLSGLDHDGVLKGDVRSSLLELHHLNRLDLSLNDFGGIPIPEFIGSMKQLQHLSLSGSKFAGSIPPQLGNLTNLHSLDLSYNSLSSTSLSILAPVFESLEILDLSYNQLNGCIPDPSAFSSLKELHLLKNNFTGSIPSSIGQLSELQVLDLSYNSLEGLVSESHFSKLDKLKTLDLSFNALILDTAPDWSPPFQLESISLGGCDVGPYFPKWIQTQRNLYSLDLRRANITDEAPRWLWSTLSLLTNLDLSDNRISGAIPNLSSTSIRYMVLSNNQFSGPIPLFSTVASDIQLSGNMLSGSILSICKTSNEHLRTLVLSNNQLSGEVPNCWENTPNLQSLDLLTTVFRVKFLALWAT
ncbi:receptor-like protein EIX2 isoform X1 [Salvia divinorum]|uniref:Receptor-like protein EIX2 isoform X1 n=1 Tax=Salvia divinorum TaxID=28513 RepID=A0ABD1HH55_SALDI